MSFGRRKGGFFATVRREVGNGRLFDFDGALAEGTVSEVRRSGSRTSQFNITQIVRLNILKRWHHKRALLHGSAAVRKEELLIGYWIISFCWRCLWGKGD